MRRDSSISRLGSAFTEGFSRMTRPLTARSTRKVQPVTSDEIDHIAVCDPAGYKELNTIYGTKNYITEILNDETEDLYDLIDILDINDTSYENLKTMYKINSILKQLITYFKSPNEDRDIVQQFSNEFNIKLVKKLKKESIRENFDNILKNLKKICALQLINILKIIYKSGGSLAKKSTKKRSKKRSAKKSTKKRSKKRSTKKRSAKKSAKKTSKKRSTKKSAKKASKKRSAKKSTKKASKKRSAKKLIAIKSQQKKRSAKKSMAKKW